MKLASEIYLSKGGRWLAAREEHGRYTGYDTRSGQRLWTVAAEEEGTMFDFARDGSWGVLGTKAGLVAIESATGRRTMLVPDIPPLRSLDIAPDGKWLAVLTTAEKGFRIVSGLPGAMPAEADVPEIKVDLMESEVDMRGPSISGDGRYMAAAVGEDRLRIWEMPSRQQTAWLRGHQRTVRGTAFHPWDSSIVASTGYDGTTRLWNIPTRQQILQAPAGGDAITFAPDRGELILRSWAGDSVRIAPLMGKQGMRVLMLPAGLPLGLFSGVAFSPDGRLLAASGDAGVIIWVLATGQIVQAQGPVEYHWRSCLFSPDGAELWISSVSGLHRQPLRFREDGSLEAGEATEIRQGKYREMAWLGGRLAVANGLYPLEGADDGRISLIDPDGKLPDEILTVPHFADTVAISRDNRWLASASFAHRIGSVIDLQSPGRLPQPVRFSSRSTLGFLPFLPAVAVGSDHDITFRLLPGEKGILPEPVTRTYSEFIPSRFAVAPDASLLAASTSSTEVSLCDPVTMTKLAALESPLTPFDFCMAFSADSRQLAMAGGVSRVVIWDLAWLKAELARSGLGW
jgi:WD40 repeat protein